MSPPSPAAPPSKPSAIKHLEQARQNYSAYERLKGTAHYDWQTTVLFYTAMHLVQSYLVQVAKTGFDVPGNHEDRIGAVHRKLREVGSDFEFLFRESMKSRYYLDQPRPTQQSADRCEARVRTIAAHLKRLGYDLFAP